LNEIIELKWLRWVEGLLLSGALAPHGKLWLLHFVPMHFTN